MRYWYKISDVMFLDSGRSEDQYYTMDEVRTLQLYTEEEINDVDFWPVHDPCGWSWEPGEYDSMDAAYDDLCRSLNLSVYEFLNDI